MSDPGRPHPARRRSLLAIVSLLSLTVPAARAADCAGALTTVAEIQAAMAGATAGATILVAPGSYVGFRSASGDSRAHFHSSRSGTASRPIVLRSCDPARPAVFSGDGENDGAYVFHLTGDHWVIEDIVVARGTKGIILDNANHNVLRRVEVHTIGDEGIHIRDGSSWNLVDQARLHDIGLVRPGYGEGVYIGSDTSSPYEHRVVGNVVRATAFMAGIGGEHMDIKEGADGTIVEYCTFDGRGISGQNYCDSFIDVKGVNTIIRHNVAHRHGNVNVVDAFQCRTHGDYPTGENNLFHDNTVDLDDSAGYLLKATSGTTRTTAYANVRVGTGKLYNSHVSILQSLGPDDPPRPASRPALALGGFQPNPARSVESLSFSLASSGEASLEIVDVQGRRMFAAEVGALGPGQHVIGAEAIPPLAPGVYLVTLVQAGQRRTARGVIVQ
jgi:hypothetical protein